MINFKNFYSTIEFNIDYDIYEVIEVTQGDTLSRGFYVRIIQGGQVIKPSSANKLTFYGKKPDGNKVSRDAVIENDMFRVDLPNQATTVPGTMDGQISLSGPNNELLTKSITINIKPSIGFDEVESTDDFSSLQQALSQIAGFAGEIEDVQLFAEGISTRVGENSLLTTEQKDTLVNAINEIKQKVDNVVDSSGLQSLLDEKVDKTTLGDTTQLITEEKEVIVNVLNELKSEIDLIKETNDVDNLVSIILSKADKEDLGNVSQIDIGEPVISAVDAINKLYINVNDAIGSLGDIDISSKADQIDVGDISLLTTEQKENLVSAVNEIKSDLTNVESVTDYAQLSTLIASKAEKSTVGTLSNLTTTAKTNLVNSINEVNSNLQNIELTPGADGQDGQDGADGLSAYEIWLNAGNTGTEQDFLASLAGTAGTDGTDGLSAYEIWLNAGNTGTEQDFLDSLKGEPGPPGEGSGGGLTIEDLPNRGSISAASDTGTVTNEHIRQVNVSRNARASGLWSQVNGSKNSTASGLRSQVNVSDNSTVSGQYSQINSSTNYNGGVNSITGTFSQISSSRRADISGSFSQVNASSASAVSNYFRGGTIGGYYSQINSSGLSQIHSGAHHAQINSSEYVNNNVPYSSAWGYSAIADSSSAANIKIHLLSETGNINHSGVLNSGHNFTDYAELFPNITDAEQGYGLIQTLDGYGVRPANEGEQAFGVTSATAGVVLGETPFSWVDRWIKDEWGAYVYHDILDPHWEPDEKAGETEEDRPTISVPKENPDWNPELEQIKRQDRPDEWTVVGLVGQVYVRLDENVQPMDYVKPLQNGVGQTSSEPTNIRVMKITQDFDESKGYKIGFCLLK